MRTSNVGKPCCAWRASSVWMLESRLEKPISPDSIASAASATNCMFVKPCSKRKVHRECSVDAIGVQEPIVAETSNCDDSPFVGMEGLLAPIETCVMLQQIMRK